MIHTVHVRRQSLSEKLNRMPIPRTNLVHCSGRLGKLKHKLHWLFQRGAMWVMAMYLISPETRLEDRDVPMSIW